MQAGCSVIQHHSPSRRPNSPWHQPSICGGRMSFPRGGWDPGWEEDLPDALGRSHPPYHSLSCSNDHVVDPWHPQGDVQGERSRPGQGQKAPGRLRSLWWTWSTSPYPGNTVPWSSSLSDLALTCFEPVWAKPGCVSSACIPAGC